MSIANLKRRALLPALLLLGLLAAGCTALEDDTIGFWDILWAMVVFYFWFMLIWIWISLVGDIFRRNDLSGVSKALWLLVLFVLPLIGALIYMIARPKVTAQDVAMITAADAAQNAAAAITPADQIEKLNQLLQAGAISVPEYEALKKKALES
jgi:hypothetical protein